MMVMNRLPIISCRARYGNLNRVNYLLPLALEHFQFQSLGERQDMIYLPLGLIVMSYLRSAGDRSSRASYGSISFFVSRTPFG